MLQALAEAAPAAALAAVCLLGLAIGSFLNVVIVRLPERRSLWRPPSACPGCGAPIAWYDNLPLLSFALLRGRCRACAMPISWRYPLVEAVTGAAFLSAYTVFGPTARFVVAAALLAALIAITAIDLQLQIIPNAITLPGIVAGVLANLGTGAVSWLEAVIGALLGGGVFVAIMLGYALLFREEGMGLGDAKLGAISAPSLVASWRAATLRAAADELAAAVNVGRLFAIAHNVPVCIAVAGADVRFEGGRAGTCSGVGLPGAAAVRLASGLVVGTVGPPVVFTGLGAATPAGRYVVVNPADGGTRSVVVAASGRVRIQ